MDYSLSIVLLLLIGLSMSIGIAIGMLWSERVLIADHGSAEMDKWWAEIQPIFEKGK